MAVTSWLNSAVETLMPAMLDADRQVSRRARTFLLCHVLGPVPGLIIAASLVYIDGALAPDVVLLSVLLAGFWLIVPLVCTFPALYSAWVQLSMVNFNLTILAASYRFEGVGSPFLMWYALIPVLSLFFLPPSAFSRLAACLQFLIGLALFSSFHGLVGDGGGDGASALDAGRIWIALSATAGGTLFAYLAARYYAVLDSDQAALRREIARHEITLAALTAAKEATEAGNRALQSSKNLADARYAELEQARASLEYNAMHDALTGLPNRRNLEQMLFARAREHRSDGRDMALLHVAIDRFKLINETLGHAAGDDMLSHVARLLRDVVDPVDFVARVGGDEFIVVVSRAALDEAALMPLAARLLEEIRKPVPYNIHICRFTASIGIAFAKGGALDPNQLLVDADIALNRAKERSRGRAEFFSQEIQSQIVETKRLADDILRGIDQSEFVAAYQPQFDAVTREIVGVEALARWRHPGGALLTPAVFLKVAEGLNAIGTIDRMILEQAIADLARWQKLRLPVPKVAVNASARRLNDPDLIRSLSRLPFRPGTIAFELVESIFLDEAEDTISANIEQLKGLGVEIEIDDFGTGYASIVSLLKLSPKRLKIDRQFVAPIAGSREKRRLVASIIEMGRSLEIEVVAEGVETMEQADILRDLGCHVLQGYAFAKPMLRDDLERFVKDWTGTGEPPRLARPA